MNLQEKYSLVDVFKLHVYNNIVPLFLSREGWCAAKWPSASWEPVLEWWFGYFLSLPDISRRSYCCLSFSLQSCHTLETVSTCIDQYYYSTPTDVTPTAHTCTTLLTLCLASARVYRLQEKRACNCNNSLYTLYLIVSILVIFTVLAPMLTGEADAHQFALYSVVGYCLCSYSTTPANQ